METMTSVDEVLEGILLQDEVKCFFFFFLLIVIGINEKKIKQWWKQISQAFFLLVSLVKGNN